MAKIMEMEDYIQKVKAIDDLEMGIGLEELLGHISPSFEQYRFNQKFKDQELEKQYQTWIYKSIINFSRTFVIEIIIVTFATLVIQIPRMVMNQSPMIDSLVTIVCTLIGVISATILQCLSRTRMQLSLQYANINNVILTVVMTEIAAVNRLQDGLSNNNGACYAVLIALQTVLTLLSYNQMHLLISYTISLLYLYTRTYFFLYSSTVYLRFLLLYSGAQLLIYFFSRFYQQREREKFIQWQKQKNLLKLFHNLIKVFNDGIIITQEENIIFYNQQISKIFNIQQTSSQVSNRTLTSGQHQEPIDLQAIDHKKKKIIEQMQSTRQQSQHEVNDQISLLTSVHNQNMWSFIMALKHEQNNDKKKDEYFKYSDKESNEKKKLQLFSQKIKYHSNNLIMTCIRDQSNWIELQRQKTLQQFQKIAFASAAHEFRNPLNAIVQSLSFIDQSITSERDRNFFMTAKNCTYLLLNLVKDILDFSQLESNNLILNISEVNILQVINFCIDMFKLKANEKGINLSLEVRNQIIQHIQTDGGRLQQILINLISNSLKYTEHGYVKVCVDKDLESSLLILTVEDTGVGINEENLKKLFQCFTKIMSHRHLNKEGVGLGLNISQKLAMALGGNLEVKSEINKGTIFTLRLPLKQYQDEQSVFEILQSSQRTDRQLTSSIRLSSIQYEDQENLLQYSFRKRADNVTFASKNVNRRTRRRLQSYSNIENSVEFEINQIENCKCPQVLMVDDEPFNLLVQSEMLKEFGLTSASEFNGKSALEDIIENHSKTCFNHKPYQLVTVDNQMPMMNGYEVAEKIKSLQQLRQISRDIKICLITGDEFLLRDNQYKEIFDYMLLKPIDSLLLKNILIKCKLV